MWQINKYFFETTRCVIGTPARSEHLGLQGQTPGFDAQQCVKILACCGAKVEVTHFEEGYMCYSDFKFGYKSAPFNCRALSDMGWKLALGHTEVRGYTEVCN